MPFDHYVKWSSLNHYFVFELHCFHHVECWNILFVIILSVITSDIILYSTHILFCQNFICHYLGYYFVSVIFDDETFLFHIQYSTSNIILFSSCFIVSKHFCSPCYRNNFVFDVGTCLSLHHHSLIIETYSIINYYVTTAILTKTTNM